eukprot:gnl/Trimastix_PCT/2097.p2 GENE.gnl/Trimastix_PCT/2097~~gnl/Trimastix_PCT/2097.p2  ORF type:complete len:249 (+),score=19.92 gnl/Trimastix_PCT/2097:545-1291(+)
MDVVHSFNELPDENWRPGRDALSMWFENKPSKAGKLVEHSGDRTGSGAVKTGEDVQLALDKVAAMGLFEQRRSALELDIADSCLVAAAQNLLHAHSIGKVDRWKPQLFIGSTKEGKEYTRTNVHCQIGGIREGVSAPMPIGPKQDHLLEITQHTKGILPQAVDPQMPVHIINHLEEVVISGLGDILLDFNDHLDIRGNQILWLQYGSSPTSAWASHIIRLLVSACLLTWEDLSTLEGVKEFFHKSPRR